MPIIDQDGTYRAKVISKEICKSSKGTEQLAVGFEVIAEGPQKGHHITDFLAFSDAALEWTEKKMRAMGWQGIDLNDLSTLGSNDVDIVCAMEHQEGYEPRMRVKFINAPGFIGNITPLEENDKRTFAAKMKAKFAALNAGQAKAKPNGAAKPQTRQEPPPHTDADIPF